MLERLTRLAALRGAQSAAAAEPGFAADIARVKDWQHARLARTYDDLAADARYAPAVAFFLDELYGTGDTALRDRDLLRMEPTMRRLLPQFAFETVDRALELDVLAEEFDQALARALEGREIDETSYAAAFRAVGREADRLRQVDLMKSVGQGLDHVVKKPMLYSTLKMLRGPARLAGLGEMQRFLEAGFTAFRHMGGAGYFLDTIARRETALITRLFARHPEPFANLKGTA